MFIFSEDAKKLADFYQGLLGEKPVWVEDGYYGFDAGSFLLTIAYHDGVHGKNPNPDRIILNFEAEDVPAEFERVKKLGASVVKEPYKPAEEQSMTIATLADPDGNYFQLMTPMAEDSGLEDGSIVMKEGAE